MDKLDKKLAALSWTFFKKVLYIKQSRLVKILELFKSLQSKLKSAVQIPNWFGIRTFTVSTKNALALCLRPDYPDFGYLRISDVHIQTLTLNNFFSISILIGRDNPL